MDEFDNNCELQLVFPYLAPGNESRTNFLYSHLFLRSMFKIIDSKVASPDFEEQEWSYLSIHGKNYSWNYNFKVVYTIPNHCIV